MELAIDWMGFRLNSDLNLKDHCKSFFSIEFFNSD